MGALTKRREAFRSKTAPRVHAQVLGGQCNLDRVRLNTISIDDQGRDRCIKETAHYASDKMVRDVAYVHDGPPRISLYTMVNNESGAGAHSA